MALLPSNLETLSYASPAWSFIFDKDFELLAQTLLKINALQDVNTTGIAAGAILVWNAATSKHICKFWS